MEAIGNSTATWMEGYHDIHSVAFRLKPLRWYFEAVSFLNHSPPPEMSRYLTMKEGAELIDKSPSSIRRIIYPIIQAENHPDRDQIEPSVEDALALRLKGENFAWRINEDYLLRVARKDAPQRLPSAPQARPHPASAEGELLAMLRHELEIKNEQIKQQSALISQQVELVAGLSERLREGNLLFASLQQRMALPAMTITPADKQASSVNKSSRQEQEEGSAPTPQPPKDRTQGRFGFLFRKVF